MILLAEKGSENALYTLFNAINGLEISAVKEFYDKYSDFLITTICERLESFAASNKELFVESLNVIQKLLELDDEYSDELFGVDSVKA